MWNILKQFKFKFSTTCLAQKLTSYTATFRVLIKDTKVEHKNVTKQGVYRQLYINSASVKSHLTLSPDIETVLKRLKI